MISKVDSFTNLDRNDDSENPQINSIDQRNCSSPFREDYEVFDSNKGNGQEKTSLGHFLPLKPSNKAPVDGPVFFFDLDNTLYPKSSGIAELMAHRIELFFVNYLKLPLDESRILGARFYKDYGLAIKGLIKHFSIDPIEYDRFVDGGLQLDQILKPEKSLTELLNNLSKKGSCWIFTNAGKSHATRVLEILELESYFSGIIYCDYSEENFPHKPDRLAFARAMKCVGVTEPSKCFFFDDSIGNIRTAQEIGWNVVFVDEDTNINTRSSSKDQINASLEILTSDPDQKKVESFTFPTIKRIQDLESVLKMILE
jgi:pyrimidine and pyridine-specific 5'-nucleotidase